MTKEFNTTGSCNPDIHYMVNISSKLAQIQKFIDKGYYFTINRARQYGKTTTIAALTRYLKHKYIVINLDFQMIGNSKFATEHTFTKAFANHLSRAVKNSDCDGLAIDLLNEIVESAKTDNSFELDDMFPLLSEMCRESKREIVLIIDEVDSATNNQVFLDFLAQLRAYYLVSTVHLESKVFPIRFYPNNPYQ